MLMTLNRAKESKHYAKTCLPGSAGPCLSRTTCATNMLGKLISKPIVYRNIVVVQHVSHEEHMVCWLHNIQKVAVFSHLRKLLSTLRINSSSKLKYKLYFVKFITGILCVVCMKSVVKYSVQMSQLMNAHSHQQTFFSLSHSNETLSLPSFAAAILASFGSKSRPSCGLKGIISGLEIGMRGQSQLTKS